MPNADSQPENFRTAEEIWTQIQRIAFAINENQPYLEALADSMHNRYAAVISAHGRYTKY